MIEAGDLVLVADLDDDLREEAQDAAGATLVLLLVEFGRIDVLLGIREHAADASSRDELAIDHLFVIGEQPDRGGRLAAARKRK